MTQPEAPIDVQQVIYALDRAAAENERQAQKLFEVNDYGAELWAEDAARLREAIALLRPLTQLDDVNVELQLAAHGIVEKPEPMNPAMIGNDHPSRSSMSDEEWRLRQLANRCTRQAACGDR